MKLKRINRMFLAFLLASGVQLSLTTCTKKGVTIPREKISNERVYQASDVDNHEEISHYQR